jgi:hypothetical protein
VQFVWLDRVDDAVAAALSDRDQKTKAAERIESSGGRQAARSG